MGKTSVIVCSVGEWEDYEQTVIMSVETSREARKIVDEATKIVREGSAAIMDLGWGDESYEAYEARKKRKLSPFRKRLREILGVFANEVAFKDERFAAIRVEHVPAPTTQPVEE